MENQLVEKLEKHGLTANIYYDLYADSPDTWGDDNIFIVYDHRDFYVKRDGFDPREIFDHVMETKKYFYDGYYVFPLYAYIHSGVALSLNNQTYPFNDSFDSTFNGFVLVKRSEFWKKSKAFYYAKNLVDTWNTYLTGDTYYYEITDQYGETLDSCYGFYGIDHVKGEMINILNFWVEYENKKEIKEENNQLENKLSLIESCIS